MRSPVADLLADLARAFGDGIDATRVRAVLSMLEHALGQSDLLAAFAQCQARART